jgi:hypothetical protein
MNSKSSVKHLSLAMFFLLAILVSVHTDWLGKWLSSRQAAAANQDHLKKDKLGDTARNLVQANTITCNGGNFYDKRTMPQADACAVAAFKAGKPFRLGYYFYSRDGVAQKELVGTSGGQGLLLSQFSASGIGEGEVSLSSCKKLIVVRFDSRQRVECHC